MIIDLVISFKKATTDAVIESNVIRNRGMVIPFLCKEFLIVIMNVYATVLFNKVCMQLFPNRDGIGATGRGVWQGVE